LAWALPSELTQRRENARGTVGARPPLIGTGIYLDAGDQIDIQVLDYSYSGPSIRMIMPDGRRLEAAAGNNYLTTMVTTAPVSGYYLVMVGLVYETGLQYELRIR
jgi:hypothetical protein